jgi:uncharacterized protein YggE
MSMRFFLLCSVAAIAAGLASGAMAQAPLESSRTVVIVGEGEQTGKPDVALVTIGVTRESETASAALRLIGQSARDVVGVLQKRGLQARDIQTGNLSLQPRYGRQRNPSDDRPVVTGYIASNQLNLRIRNIDGLGELLDELLLTGSNEIRGVSFTIEDRSKLLDDARVRAVQDARRKASLFAAAADIRLGEIINFQDETSVPQLRAQVNRSYAESAGASTPIEAGELSLRATVKVTWRILQ